jgi:hypothetical protein
MADISQESDKVAAASANVAAIRTEISRAKEAVQAAKQTVATSSNEVLQVKGAATATQTLDEKKAEIMQNAKDEAAAVVQAKNAEQKEVATKKSAERAMQKRHEELVQAVKDKNTRQTNADTLDVKRVEEGVKVAQEVVKEQNRDVKRQKALVDAAKFKQGLDAQDLKLAVAEEKSAAKEDKKTKQSSADADNHILVTQAAVQALNEEIANNKVRTEGAKQDVAKMQNQLTKARVSASAYRKRAGIANNFATKLSQQISTLEAKQKAATLVGQTIKEKANRDYETAQSALFKARGDFSSASKRYNLYTAKAKRIQKKVDKAEVQRKTTVTSLLHSLSQDELDKAAKAGEFHIGLEAIIEKHVAQRDVASGKAQNQKAMMKAAQQEEKQALELEVSGNHQLNMAAMHASSLKSQEENIKTLYNQYKERKAEGERFLGEAKLVIASAMKGLHHAKKKYESRVAAHNFLVDVKLVAAEEQAAKARATKENTKKLVESGEAGLEAKTQKLAVAKGKVDTSSDKYAEAQENEKLSQQKLQEVIQKKDETVQSLSAIKTESAAHRKQEGQEVAALNARIAAEKLDRHRNLTKAAYSSALNKLAGRTKNLNAKSEKLSGAERELHLTKASAASGRSSALKQKVAVTQDMVKAIKAQHGAATNDLDTANMAVKKATHAYVKAFGTKPPASIVEEEQAKAAAKAKSVHEKASKALAQP